MSKITQSQKVSQKQVVSISPQSPETPQLTVPPARKALQKQMTNASNGTNVSNVSAVSNMTYLTASTLDASKTNTSTNSSSNFDSWTSRGSLQLEPVDTEMELIMGEDDYFEYMSPDGSATEKMMEYLHQKYID